MAVTVIKEGTPYYSGKHASVPERADGDIPLCTEWAMLSLCPDGGNKKTIVAASDDSVLSSAKKKFLSQPARGGGSNKFCHYMKDSPCRGKKSP